MKKQIAGMALIGATLATTFMSTPAAQAAETGPRIGVLSGGTLSVKEGSLWSSWTAQLNDVAKFEIDGDRIGVLTTGGDVLVKEGDLYAQWTTQLGGARDFHLAGG